MYLMYFTIKILFYCIMLKILISLVNQMHHFHFSNANLHKVEQKINNGVIEKKIDEKRIILVIYM